MTVLVCSAHADDEVIGVGGTIAKMAKEEDVIVLIFSYGGGSFAGLSDRLTSWPPMMSEEKLIETRVKESKKADELLGVKETIFLGIKGNIPKEFKLEQKEKLKAIINQYKPDKIFYHSVKDGHPDHLAVNKVMHSIIEKMQKKPEIYTYQINLFDFSMKESKLIIDVSKEFQKKLNALAEFKSQVLWTTPLKFMVLLKAIIFGKKQGFKFAEYFYTE